MKMYQVIGTKIKISKSICVHRYGDAKKNETSVIKTDISFNAATVICHAQI